MNEVATACLNGSRWYSREQKLALVEKIQQRHQAEGRPIKDLLSDAGVSPLSYYTWRKALQPAAPAPLRAVEVVATPEPASTAGPGPVVVTPQGCHITGLSVGQIAELLRALA